MLLLCYIFPPLAVLLMGRPFSAMYNFLLFIFWIPGIKHALVCYADWKSGQHVDRVVGAINNPAHAKGGGSTVVHNHYHAGSQPISNPYVGVNGTVFRRKN